MQSTHISCLTYTATHGHKHTHLHTFLRWTSSSGMKSEVQAPFSWQVWNSLIEMGSKQNFQPRPASMGIYCPVHPSTPTRQSYRWSQLKPSRVLYRLGAPGSLSTGIMGAKNPGFGGPSFPSGLSLSQSPNARAPATSPRREKIPKDASTATCSRGSLWSSGRGSGRRDGLGGVGLSA